MIVVKGGYDLGVGWDMGGAVIWAVVGAVTRPGDLNQGEG